MKDIFSEYIDKLNELHNDLSFLPEKMKIKKNRKACS